ncbi:sulfhydryl oxidase 2-like isoform X2 [Periplaneta americana]|uniref:sulfhydryl oxidase 2-like isoform X2 n=1 Tax=Periplaneta americana TaxID=6978 RepID=UPI0037E76761
MNQWKDVITVAAVDCANDDNNPLCREYEIMHYPMLKFFSANSKPDHMGVTVNKGKNVDEARSTLVEILEKEHIEGRGIGWPNIAPYRSSDIKNLWKLVPSSVKFIILIFEDTESFIGTEVILDLHHIDSIQVRSVLNQNEAVSKLMGVSTFPSLVVVERNMQTFSLSVSDESRESFRKAIRSFLQSRHISIPEEEPSTSPEETHNMEISDLLSIMAAEEEKKKQQGIKQMGDIVFQVDLEKAVAYSLQHEVSSFKLISGEAFTSLKDYLNVLVKYLPFSSRGVNVLSNLRNAVFSHANDIGGERVLEYLKKFDNGDSSVFSSHEWIGCKGSKPQYRGYPCGLWTLFHTLTVNAVLQNQQLDSLEVLNAMLGYITYFFGCQDCSKHFQEMAARSMHSEVNSPKESILWLWKAHNEANKRLSGDVSEDPEHIKIQFPSRTNCPTCRNNDDFWNIDEVLHHLKQMYGKSNISYIGISSDKRPQEYTLSNEESRFAEQFIANDGERKRLGWNFNFFDISLCVVLYAFSATILVLVCIKFVMRRRYRKKLYIHDILGKV